MRFEHLVQINDPLQPLLTEVSRAQLWHGLARRAIRIEEPAAGGLYLRFTCESDEEPADGELDSLTMHLREQACRSADIDAVWRLRDLVERGELD